MANLTLFVVIHYSVLNSDNKSRIPRLGVGKLPRRGGAPALVLFMYPRDHDRIRLVNFRCNFCFTMNFYLGLIVAQGFICIQCVVCECSVFLV